MSLSNEMSIHNEMSGTDNETDMKVKKTSSDLLKEIEENNLQINVLSATNKKLVVSLTKLINKELKSKKSDNKKKPTGTRSGLSIPITISDDLTNLLKLDNNTSSRAEITSLISKYIKEHDLKNPNKENKKYISPNKEFKKILKQKDESGELIDLDEDILDNLTYMNYQKYIQHHFTKK